MGWENLNKARGELCTAGSASLWYKTVNISSRLVSTQKGTVSRRSHLREGQVNTKGEDLLHVFQAHRHPALHVTYSNQCFIVPFHIPISNFFPFSHLFPFFLGEVYRDVFESIFRLRKIIDFISDLLI